MISVHRKVVSTIKHIMCVNPLLYEQMFQFKPQLQRRVNPCLWFTEHSSTSTMWKHVFVLVTDFASKVHFLSIPHCTRYLCFRSWRVKRPHVQQPTFFFTACKNEVTVNNQICNTRELLKTEKCVWVEWHWKPHSAILTISKVYLHCAIGSKIGKSQWKAASLQTCPKVKTFTCKEQWKRFLFTRRG
jgi:hypothetical protein